jgi:hypothetical protein
MRATRGISKPAIWALEAQRDLDCQLDPAAASEQDDHQRPERQQQR